MYYYFVEAIKMMHLFSESSVFILANVSSVEKKR